MTTTALFVRANPLLNHTTLVSKSVKGRSLETLPGFYLRAAFISEFRKYYRRIFKRVFIEMQLLFKDLSM